MGEGERACIGNGRRRGISRLPAELIEDHEAGCQDPEIVTWTEVIHSIN